jgi:isocitrate/isopropylmalate dehydrogenase
MLLDHIAQPTRASLLRAAIDRVLRQGPRTPDLGGEAGTDDVTKATLAALEEATR